MGYFFPYSKKSIAFYLYWQRDSFLMKGQDSEGYHWRVSPLHDSFCFETKYIQILVHWRVSPLQDSGVFTLHSYLSNTYPALCTAGRISISGAEISRNSQKPVGNLYDCDRQFNHRFTHGTHNFIHLNLKILICQYIWRLLS